MTTRALLVGVPATADPRFPAIPGVSGDVAQVEEALVGFDHVDARPGGCSRQDFVDAMLELRSSTVAGDLTVVYFSGHGYSSHDASGRGDEPWDECLVFSDALLNDDWFRQYWKGIADGSRWVTFADACFSATIMLGIGVEPPVRDVAHYPSGVAWRVHLAASQDEEFAFLAEPDEPGFGLARSQATAAMLCALAASPGATYREVWRAVDAAAADALRANMDRGRPVMSNISPDDRLLDSPAFAPLRW